MKSNGQLRYERELRGWSQSDLAQQIGTTALSVSRWESGVTVPIPHFRRKLCALFNKSAEELGLLTGDSENSAGSQKALSSDHTLPSGSLTRLCDPAIPSSFLREGTLIGRQVELEYLRQQLVAHADSTAVFGLPGVGKTALALALIYDCTIRNYFRDGVFWVSLGRQPQRLRLLKRWGALLGLTSSEVEKITSPDIMAEGIRDAIGMRCMLLIIDDVWEIKDALNFKVGGMQCVHLITTRFPPIALHFADDKALPIHELCEHDGLNLLQQFTPSIATKDLDRMRELVRLVGGLPLALRLIGKYLQVQARNQQPRRIHAALEQLYRIDARLNLTEWQAPTERSFHLSADTPLSLQSAIESSEQQLSLTDQKGLYALSIFPAKPNSFSEAAALAICDLTEATLDRLTDAGLLESCGPDRYTLHQVIADFAAIRRANASIEEKMVQFFLSFIEAHRFEDELLEKEYVNILKAFEIASSKNMITELRQGIQLLEAFLAARGISTLSEKYLGQVLQIAR